MTNNNAINAGWVRVFLALAAVGMLSGPAAAQGEYVQADVEISGKKINAFSDGDEQVSVVLGEFKMTVGERVVTGRDAVVWIATRQAGQTVLRDVRVYVEGDVVLSEPDGASTGDRAMYITFFVRGRVKAGGGQTEQTPLKDLPLYRRAMTARREGEGLAEPSDTTDAPAGADGRDDQPSTQHSAPELFRLDEPPVKRRDADQPDSSSTPSSDDEPMKLPFEVVRGSADKAAVPDRSPVVTIEPTEPNVVATQPGQPDQTPVQPVNFYAKELVSQKVGEDGRRVTVFTGGVYLSQGDPDPDSEYVLELRSQDAVVFSEVLGEDASAMPIKDTYAPFSPQIGRNGQETIVGIYLYGDVVISRGERFMRGPEAYYDFTSDRAIMIDPVFKSVQAQRNIPIYVRAAEGRMLSAREMWFRDAKVSTSEFASPTYHFAGRRVYMMDETAYDAKGTRISQRRAKTKVKGATVFVRSVPVMYFPWLYGDAEQGHTALRSVRISTGGSLGFVTATKWSLFRVLGLSKPEGFSGALHLNYRRGPEIGVDMDYARRNYSGYSKLWGMVDRQEEDEFGRLNKDIPAQQNRGRVLIRHKQYLPRDWQMQFELSYLCDKNYLRQFFPDEFYAGKEQETLLYAKKQRDNWALDVLLKARINRFLTQTESAPDVGFRILGEPLLGDRLTSFAEARAGAKQYRQENDLKIDDSGWMGRFDARGEIDWPVHVGPLNLVPYVAARGDYWTASPEGGKSNRVHGEVGIRADTHLWRIYNNVDNRFWDLHKLKHIITPEVVAMLTANTATPAELYPLSPAIEEHIEGLSGVTFGVRQRLQTKRGKAGKQRTVDWMRLDVMAGFFDADPRFHPSADGRFFASRPEYSLGRDFINVDYAWKISDATTFLADMNYDINQSDLGRAGVGLAVRRDPRVDYFLGLRTIKDMETAVLTFAARYKINRKYTVTFSEQYDLDYDGGTNLSTTLTVTRKFPRWYVGLAASYDARYRDVTLMLQFWPEGIPEFMVETGEIYFPARSKEN